MLKLKNTFNLSKENKPQVLDFVLYLLVVGIVILLIIFLFFSEDLKTQEKIPSSNSSVEVEKELKEATHSVK